MKKKAVLLYQSFWPPLKKLSLEDRGALLTAIMQHLTGETLIELSPVAAVAWSFIQDQIDRDFAEYENRCAVNRENINKRWNTTVYDRKNGIDSYYKEDEKEKESIKESKPKKTTLTKFIIPSFEDVAGYCRQRNNGIDAQRFIDYYEANGWRVGKNPMKSWQAALRTWERQNAAPVQPLQKVAEPLKPLPPPIRTRPTVSLDQL